MPLARKIATEALARPRRVATPNSARCAASYLPRPLLLAHMTAL